MRNRTFKAVQWFYLCVMMSLKFWWVLLKNFIVYGLVDAINSVILYYAAPPRERDLHQRFKADNHFQLAKAKILSLSAACLISLWLACIGLIKEGKRSLGLTLAFWVLAAWTIMFLAYLIELTLVKAKEKYSQDNRYYLKALILFLRCPQITLTSIVLLIVLSLLFTKNPIIAALIMPGIIGATVCHLYELLAQKQQLPQ